MALSEWKPAKIPPRERIGGRFCRLEPLDPHRHGDDLWEALEISNTDKSLWDFLSSGPFSDRAAFDAWVTANAAGADPLFFAAIDLAAGRALGLLSLMSIVPEHGRIEIGHIAFGSAMQRQPPATEAVYLLAALAFDELGYRRLEWKCDAGNVRSRRAALRLGFEFEGIFRQHMVVKGVNRDTAWFAIVDRDWPQCRRAFHLWLHRDNFDAVGSQRAKLADLRSG